MRVPRHVLSLIGLPAVLLEPSAASAASTGGDSGFTNVWLKTVVMVVAGVLLAAALLAAAELGMRTLRQRRWSGDRAPILSALAAHRYHQRVLYVIAPAAVASAIAAVRHS